MTTEIPRSNPEKEKPADDNARKFIMEPIDAQFLRDVQATSFVLSVDWLETDEDSEKKLARKTLEDGTVETSLIAKVTKTDGDRKRVKEPISNEKYNEYITDSLLHLEKERYEFSYRQDGVVFDMKYDVFANSKLHMLEVDATSESERMAFLPKNFPSELKEVTEDISYTGYRVCELLK